VGHRRAHPTLRALRAAALLALALGALLASLALLWTLAPDSWDRAKPTRLLLLEVDKARPSRAALALHELVRREASLSRPTLAWLAQRAMAQSERSRESMQRDWWKAIDAARRAGAIDDDRAAAFIATWFRVDLATRATVREDRPLFVSTSLAPVGAMLPDAAARVSRLSIRPKPGDHSLVSAQASEATPTTAPEPVHARLRTIDRLPHALPPGEHAVLLSVSLELHDASAPESRPTIVSAVRELRLRVLPAGEPLVPLARGEDASSLVAENLSLRLSAIRAESGEVSLRPVLALAPSASILTRVLETNLAYDVIAHRPKPDPASNLPRSIAERRRAALATPSWPLGSLVLHLADREATRQLGEPAEAFILVAPGATTLPADFDLTRVDIELRPSPAVAEPFPQLATILAEPAWYRGVPIHWAD
jgi:hypothetical protein